MQDSSITLVGNLVGDPVLRRLDDGTPVASFRVGSTPRRFDRASGRWVDAETSWWGVTCWRALAENVAASLERGQRVVVVGRPRTRSWERDGRSGTSVDITAEAVGHDLGWGTSSFARVVRSERVPTPGREEADSLAEQVQDAHEHELVLVGGPAGAPAGEGEFGEG